ncbi:flagellar basal-body MS-ring/collar protein FliF [Desulfobacula sp.]|uniref:Flagellar M-ring protein n=1 Tax=Candidatus Desulfatibia vada TaxID=2841696 RepID=A0A8J6P4W1_9BACT|nr:flagellar M-ring protein FliF [Candidatus Desulfatibia vada]MBL6996233.1 flagellar M-ring protein FliF [Desulfobacula sp.]
MSDSISQFANLLNALPLSKKISMVFIIVLLGAGFAGIFYLGNQEDYQVLYNNLSPEDGGVIVTKLKERNIPYKVEANGTIVMVPTEKIYELRLSLAGEGLPKSGNVGYEIFDKSDFSTTQFVQELNYRRALQGELVRTINQFDEVSSSRVFIVVPQASLFVEDEQSASASIQLDLSASLPANKLAAIVHLVASAVEGLDADQVTVVDTKGRLIFKGDGGGEAASLVSNAQLEYKRNVENEIKESVQTMMEGIAGAGRAIVRVNAEIDFNKITLNQEEYDPSTTAVRSTRNIEESEQSGGENVQADQAMINQRRGVVPSAGGVQNGMMKKDVATNYEINKITSTILKPAGTILRLSVAAVIDGTYKTEKQQDGTIKKTYVARSADELKKFDEIVKKAMGYSEDREDQVTVSSISFADSGAGLEDLPAEAESSKLGILKQVLGYKKTIINLLLAAILFVLVIRPLMQSMKNLAKDISIKTEQLSRDTGREHEQLADTSARGQMERVMKISRESNEKAQQLIKGWIGENE